MATVLQPRLTKISIEFIEGQLDKLRENCELGEVGEGLVNSIMGQLDELSTFGPQSVLQPWVEELTMMQQSVLLSALRGPDGLRKEHPVKDIMRWYRRCVMVAAFGRKIFTDPYEEGGGNYTGPVSQSTGPMKLMKQLTDYMDEMPLHFYTHFMYGAEVLGYKHPVKGIRVFWLDVYESMVRKLNLTPETEERMDRRLGDDEKKWRETT